jgi:hypothetical protein
MKSVQFLVDFNAVDGAGNSYVKFAVGEIYPLNDETACQVAAGYAQEVDSLEVPRVPVPVPEAPSTAASGEVEIANAASTVEFVAQDPQAHQTI